MQTRRRFLGQFSRSSVALAAQSMLPWRVYSSMVTDTGAGSLRAHAAARALLYGSAVDIGMLRNDAAYRALLIEQCGILVAENGMKWPAVHPAPEVFRFDQADELVDFAEKNRMKVRGHNLVWHEALPGWFPGTVTPLNAAQFLTTHIRTVAGRYKGRMRAWDVVNEAVWLPDGRGDGLRNSPWLRLLGPGYLDLAFRTAREADPHALLTYNDYGIEYDTPQSVAKRSAILTLLRRLKASGTPIDALGIQAHLDASTDRLGPGIVQFAIDARALGLKVFITEMDVNDDNLVQDDPAERDAAVARVYKQFVTEMVTKASVSDILTWGLSDDHSWLNNSKWHNEKHPGRRERALPFDINYQPKPAFYALRAALDSKSEA